MQRMQLHLSGVCLPKLGSLQDRMYRQYLNKVSLKELEKSKFEVRLASFVASLLSGSSNLRREEVQNLNKAWSSYAKTLFNLDSEEETSEESRMQEYYQRFVKNAKLRLIKQNEGDWKLSGDSKSISDILNTL